MFLWFIGEPEHRAKPERGLEGMSPSRLGRRGWSRHTLSPGDKVSIAYYLLKDHRPGGFQVSIKLPNGPMSEVLPAAGAGRSGAAAIAYDVPNGENP
jgi:hypothetical protein